MIESTPTLMLTRSESSPVAKRPASEDSSRESGAFADFLAKSAASTGPADEHAAQKETSDSLDNSVNTADISKQDCAAVINNVDQALMVALLGDGVPRDPVHAGLPTVESASFGPESGEHVGPGKRFATSGRLNTANNNLRAAIGLTGILPSSVVASDMTALPLPLETVAHVLSNDRGTQAVNIYNDSHGSTSLPMAEFSSNASGAPKAPAVTAGDFPIYADEQYQRLFQATEEVPVTNLTTGATILVGNYQGVHAPDTTLLVPTRLDSPAWSKDFGQHVIRLAVEGQPAAEIHLNPPELGPIRVLIEMNGQDATLQFTAEHAHTREALEGALPRLREMFSAGALTLTGAEVAGQTFSHHSSNPQERPPDQTLINRQGMRSLAVVDISPVSLVSARSLAGRSGVDLFA